MNMKNFEGFKRFFGRRKVLSEQLGLQRAELRICIFFAAHKVWKDTEEPNIWWMLGRTVGGGARG